MIATAAFALLAFFVILWCFQTINSLRAENRTLIEVLTLHKGMDVLFDRDERSPLEIPIKFPKNWWKKKRSAETPKTA